MHTYKKLLAVLVSVAASSDSLAAPGELDSEFGSNGLAAFGLGRGRAAVQQSDGKLLIAVSSWDSDFQVLRLTADGTLDPSFGTNGTAIVDFGGRDQAANLALMPDGKIVVVGKANGWGADSKFAVARLNTNGTLDASFGGDGRVVIDTGHSWQTLSSVVATADGSVVAAGSHLGEDTHDIVLIRLLSDGALDPTFRSGAMPGVTYLDTGIHEQASQLIQMPDGKYLACGFAEIDELVYVGTMLAVRLNRDGSLDHTFGAGGFARLETAARGYPSAAAACLAHPDGTIVLAGWELREPGRTAALLVRLRSDGVRDTAIWDNGVSALELGRGSAALAIVPLDGDLAIAGYSNAQSMSALSLRDSYVARIDGATGTLDEDFGHRGVTILDFSHDLQLALEASFAALLRQADGKLVAVGGAWLQTDGWDAFDRTTAARIDPSGPGHPGIAGFIMPWVYVDIDATLSVRRTGGSTGTLLVDFETVGRTAVAPRDYTHTRGTLIWGDGEVDPKTINVPITAGEPTREQKYFEVLLSTPAGTLAPDEARVYAPSVEHGSSSSSATTSSPAPIVSQTPNTWGGGAAGLETLLLLGVATLLSKRRRLASVANRVTAASSVA